MRSRTVHLAFKTVSDFDGPLALVVLLGEDRL